MSAPHGNHHARLAYLRTSRPSSCDVLSTKAARHFEQHIACIAIVGALSRDLPSKRQVQDCALDVINILRRTNELMHLIDCDTVSLDTELPEGRTDAGSSGGLGISVPSLRPLEVCLA
jgi:hypothetical protein